MDNVLIQEHDVDENFSQILQKMYITEDAFYSVFLSGIDRRILYSDDPKSASIPFAAVGKSDTMSYRLYINTKGWDRLKRLEKKYNITGLRQDVIKHEAQHIAYMHPTTWQGYTYHQIFNIAADLEINQTLPTLTTYTKGVDNTAIEKELDRILNSSLSDEDKKKQYKELMQNHDPVFMILENFGFKPNLGTSAYYDLLLKMQKSYDNWKNNGCKGSFADKFQKEENESGPNSGVNEGKFSTEEKKNIESSARMISNMKKSKDFADAIAEAIGSGDWDKFENNDPTNEIANAKIKKHIRDIFENSKSIGNIPNGFKAHLENMIIEKIPAADWKRALRLLSQSAIDYYTKLSARKLNKRNPDFRAIKIKPKLRIFCCTDSSGSMGSDDLKECFSEIELIRKTNRAEIDLGECDAELYISEICKVSRNTMVEKTSVTGGGGTSVAPVIDYVNKNKGLYSCVIYLTDGHVPEPENKCMIPMITVITSKGADPENLRPSGKFGNVIKMTNND